MEFRTWFETEMGLGTLPFSVNRGTATPASDEVKRTGLQPQVDAQEIRTKEKDEQDKILAIDDMIKNFDKDIPEGDDGEKVNKFKALWDKLKEKWEDAKSDEEAAKDDLSGGLGSRTGDQSYIKQMQQQPNALLTGPGQLPQGPGTFGTS